MEEAQRARRISRGGIRVRIPRTGIWARFRVVTLEPSEFEAPTVAQDPADAVMVMLERANGGAGRHADVDALIEVPNDEWVITDFGVECALDTYTIAWESLNEDWSYVGSKPWVNAEKFDRTLTLARQLRDRRLRRKGGS